MIDDSDRLNRDETMVKDKTEIELEKLVFGDESGFIDALKSYKDASTQLRDLVNGGRRQVQNGLGEESLGGLDDADVCKAELPIGLLLNIFPAVLP